MMSSGENVGDVFPSKSLYVGENHSLLQVSQTQLAKLPQSSGIDMIWVHQNHCVVLATRHLLHVLPLKVLHESRVSQILRFSMAGLTVHTFTTGQKLSLIGQEKCVVESAGNVLNVHLLFKGDQSGNKRIGELAVSKLTVKSAAPAEHSSVAGQSNCVVAPTIEGVNGYVLEDLQRLRRLNIIQIPVASLSFVVVFSSASPGEENSGIT